MPEREEVKPEEIRLRNATRRDIQPVTQGLGPTQAALAIADVDALLSTNEQLTKERDELTTERYRLAAELAETSVALDEARAELHEADDPMAIALVADALNKEQEENHALRAEVARLRTIVGPDCPACQRPLSLHVREEIRDASKRLVDGFKFYGKDKRTESDFCRITVADLLANHPAIAREIGVSE